MSDEESDLVPIYGAPIPIGGGETRQGPLLGFEPKAPPEPAPEPQPTEGEAPEEEPPAPEDEQSQGPEPVEEPPAPETEQGQGW